MKVEFSAPLGAGSGVRLAAQVQARTQQLAAAKGQSKNVLEGTHGLNLAAACERKQARGREPTYNVYGRAYEPKCFRLARSARSSCTRPSFCPAGLRRSVER
jgi:hypothetical protein